MDIYLLIVAITLLSGFVQAVTGFGSGIIMMLWFPSLLSMAKAPAYSDFIVTPILALMAWQGRKNLKIHKVWLPTAVYFLSSTVAIFISAHLGNLRYLQAALGLFLLVLAAYFTFISKNIQLRPTVLTAVICGIISGVTGGLFGIGGPLMAAYFLATTESKEEYLANNCMYLILAVIGNDAIRTANGMFDYTMLPVILCGIAAALVGLLIGTKVSSHINVIQLKRCVYALMAFSGTITFLKGLGIL